MRKFFIIGGAVLAAVAVVVVAATLALPRKAPAADIRIERTPERIARGEYLFNAVTGCAVCHSERDWSRFGAPPVPPIGAGRACSASGEQLPGMANEGGMPGRICFRNITPHNATGVGEWTDGELLRAIREGISRDGDALFPIMPYFIFRALSDADARALVAYMRTLAPVEHDQPETTIDFPLSLFLKLLPRPLDGPVDPPAANPVARGRYLATIARCAFCHTPQDPRSRQPVEGREFAGGVPFNGPNGALYSTNLTPHVSGIGALDQASFIALFRRTGVPADTDAKLMPWASYAAMTDEDIAAIYAFLKTLPPIETELPVRSAM